MDVKLEMSELLMQLTVDGVEGEVDSQADMSVVASGGEIYAAFSESFDGVIAGDDGQLPFAVPGVYRLVKVDARVVEGMVFRDTDGNNLDIDTDDDDDDTNTDNDNDEDDDDGVACAVESTHTDDDDDEDDDTDDTDDGNI